MSAPAPQPSQRWLGPRAPVLGLGVSAITFRDALAALDAFVRAGLPRYVCITGVHGVMESRADPQLRAIHEAAALVTPDGMPLVFMANRLGFGPVERVYGPDLMRAVCADSARRGYRHFLYGGAPGVAEGLAESLRGRYAGIAVVGTHCPPFRPLSEAEDAAVVAAINASRPDIVWVGLSTPKQERWMAAHLGRIEAPVMIGVGAAFDFLAGTKRQAPRWMQRSGLEWLFRLATEPRRLAGRYASIVPRFLVLAGLQLARDALGRSRRGGPVPARDPARG